MQETDRRGHTITPKHHSRMIAKIMTEQANRCHIIPTMNNNNAQRSNRPPCDSHSTAALSNYRGSSGSSHTYHCLYVTCHMMASATYLGNSLDPRYRIFPGPLAYTTSTPNARPPSGGRDWTPASLLLLHFRLNFPLGPS